MGYKFNIFTGTLDIVESGGGGSGVIGIAPTTDKAIVRWDGTTAAVIQNSPGTFVQDSGAIESFGFITNRNTTGTITINTTESWISPGLEMQPGSIIILEPGAELIII